MPDLQKIWTGHGADIAVAAGSLAADGDLDSALINSLYSDRRAEPDDRLPDPGGGVRGWWGDNLATVPDGDRFGSRLWLLSREKQTSETLNRAVAYTKEALAWLVEDGVAATVEVEAQWARMGVLGLHVKITRPTGETVDRRYEYAWTQVGN